MVGWAAVGRLQAYAAKTSGVAGRGGWDRCFPSAIKKVFSRKAVVVNSASCKLHQQPVFGELSDKFLNKRVKLAIIVIARQPVLVRIHSAGSYHEPLVLLVPPHGCV
jgi:hypothetical protein